MKTTKQENKSTESELGSGKDKSKIVQLKPETVTKELAKEESVAVKIEEKDKEKKPFDMKAFLADEENIKSARMLASQIKEFVSKNWFDLDRYLKKAKGTREEAITRLASLQQFGFCLNKSEGNKILFKINFDPHVEIAMIDTELANLELRKKILVRKKDELFETAKKQAKILEKKLPEKKTVEQKS